MTELACALGAAVRADRFPSGRPSASLLAGTFVSQRADLVRVDRDVVCSAAEAGVRHGLSALDAIHVASALVLRDADPTLVSWDEDQRRAAHAAGLRVYP